MADPGTKLFNFDYNSPLAGRTRDLDWSWYPHAGPYSLLPGVDDFKAVISWQEFLRGQNYRVVTYSQVDPEGALAKPVLELAGVVRYIREHYPSALIVLLAHSRGGVLARKCLKDYAGDTALIAGIAGLITLHSPHQGTQLANAPAEVNNLLNQLESLVGGLAARFELATRTGRQPFFPGMRGGQSIP